MDTPIANMLLAATNNHQQYASEEAFIIQLFTQNRYAEAYTLLLREPQNETATQYNMALCHHWAGNYQQAITSLDKAQSALPAASPQPALPNDQFFKLMRERQSQENDHLHAISKKYVITYSDLTRDAIIRLKTDCWLQLANMPKVIEVATPIAHKNYKNIIEALQIAQKPTNHE